MGSNNPRVIALLIVCLPWANVSADSMAQPEPAPAVTEGHRAFLSRVARRTIGDALRMGDPQELRKVPEGLASVSAEVLVRLRHHGYLLVVGSAGPSPVATAVRDAALNACRSVSSLSELADESDDLLIEIEVLGTPAALPAGIDWTMPGAMDAHLEPGIDGVVVAIKEKSRRVCPSDFAASDMPVDDALKLLAQGLLLSAEQVPKTAIMRFRSVHWYEARAGEPVVSLQRGMTVVSPDSASPAGLKSAIDKLAEYMVYRQRESGLFAYQFEPGADRYSDEDNVVRQAGAALAMATHARWSGSGASRAAADAAINYQLQSLKEFPSTEGARFIATPDGKNKLGVTALVALAMSHHPDAARFDEVRRSLVRGMLALQRPSGLFVTAFPPAVDLSGQDYFPGEALLALAHEYDRSPSGAALEAFDRAIVFYRDYFEASRAPAFVTWQVQAFAMMAKHTQRKDYIDYVFALTDYLADKQLSSSNCPWPELQGGIAAAGDGRPSAATASYLQAFADALLLARRVGDLERARRYEPLVRGSARFVMQLQFRPEEAYFVRSAQDVVGGIRTAPAISKLRIDHCQHALLGLIKSREALYPTDD